MPNWGGGGKPIKMIKIVFVTVIMEGLRFWQ